MKEWQEILRSTESNNNRRDLTTLSSYFQSYDHRDKNLDNIPNNGHHFKLKTQIYGFDFFQLLGSKDRKCPITDTIIAENYYECMNCKLIVIADKVRLLVSYLKI